MRSDTERAIVTETKKENVTEIDSVRKMVLGWAVRSETVMERPWERLMVKR